MCWRGGGWRRNCGNWVWCGLGRGCLLLVPWVELCTTSTPPCQRWTLQTEFYEELEEKLHMHSWMCGKNEPVASNGFQHNGRPPTNCICVDFTTALSISDGNVCYPPPLPQVGMHHWSIPVNAGSPPSSWLHSKSRYSKGRERKEDGREMREYSH